MSPEIAWIGNSGRLFHGEPDTFFGWYRDVDNVAVVVKHVNPNAHPHAELVVAHEALMLRRLDAWGLGAPRLRRLDGTHLHIEFGGHSLKRLTESGAGTLTLTELAMLFRHLCRRGEELAEAGVLHLDLRAANVVVPSENSADGGRLCLDQPIFIDFSNTLQSGLDARRPSWINPRMAQFAPEVREILQLDQSQMAAAFQAHGVKLCDLDQLSVEGFERVREAYRDYSAPQALQFAVDTGTLNSDAALQYSLGLMLHACLGAYSASSATERRRLASLTAIAERLSKFDPADRYGCLGLAATDFAALCRRQPNRSKIALGPVRPETLFAPTPEIAELESEGIAGPEEKKIFEPMAMEVASETGTLGPYPVEVPAKPSTRRLHASASRRVPVFAITSIALACMGLTTHAVWLGQPSRYLDQARLTATLKTEMKSVLTWKDQLLTVASHGETRDSRRLESAEAQMASLRRQLKAGPIRDSLAARLLAGEKDAVSEWAEVRPQLATLAQAGVREAGMWLDYCDKIVKSSGSLETIRT